MDRSHHQVSCPFICKIKKLRTLDGPTFCPLSLAGVEGAGIPGPANLFILNLREDGPLRTLVAPNFKLGEVTAVVNAARAHLKEEVGVLATICDLRHCHQIGTITSDPAEANLFLHHPHHFGYISPKVDNRTKLYVQVGLLSNSQQYQFLGGHLYESCYVFVCERQMDFCMVVGYTYPSLKEEQLKDVSPEQTQLIVFNYLGDMGTFMGSEKRPYHVKKEELESLGVEPLTVNFKYQRFLPPSALMKILEVFARHPNRPGQRLSVPPSPLCTCETACTLSLLQLKQT